MKLVYKNTIPVAGHRGCAKFYPENTMVSFRAAAELNVDMIETDVHMTKDGHIIMMHDHKTDRTSDGKGLIREKTLAQIKELDAGSWKDERFCGERVPTFEEFLDFFAAYPDMLFNIELKDYPADSGDFAYESAYRTIDMMREAGIMERSVINSFSGELNERLADEFGDGIRIHAYSPQELMGANQKRFVYTYAYCLCLFGVPEKPVPELRKYKLCEAYGVEPWAYFPKDSEALYDEALEKGARLFTSNDPEWAMTYLRSKGLHK